MRRPGARRNDAERLLAAYPKIFFACHTRHRSDPRTGRKLSAHQGSILDHLDEVEATSLMDLARHMGVTASTMSLNVDRLERKGYVTRQRDARDRRRVKLRLAAAGVRVKEAQSVLEPARVRGLLGQLSEQERRAALAGLEMLAQAAMRYMARGPGKKLVGFQRSAKRDSSLRLE